MQIKEAYPPGHFYSVIPLLTESSIQEEEDKKEEKKIPFLGLDFRDDRHWTILKELPTYLTYFDTTFGIAPFEDKEDLDRKVKERTNYFFYSIFNDNFGWMDARLLYYLLQKKKPRKIIEIGCGNSTLLIFNTKKMFGLNLEIICIEPYPHDYILTLHKEGHVQLIESKLEDVESDIFSSLEANDILFIDSSHVGKYKSDVLFYFSNIFPLLKKNVLVHIHDIFFPLDYPSSWLKIGRFWNEQYFLYVFLQYNTKFSVLFGNAYALYKFPKQLFELQKNFYEHQHQLAFPATPFGGGSFWLVVESDEEASKK